MTGRGHDKVLVLIGKVVSVNFPKRQLRVLPETDHPERFLGMRQVVLETSETTLQKFDVEHVEVLAQGVLITLSSDYLTEKIESAKNAGVVVCEEDRYPLAEDEYYVDELIGMRVLDPSGHVLGRVHAVYRTGANDVYEICDDRNRELMVPAVKERILNVDVENSVLTIDPEGLL